MVYDDLIKMMRHCSNTDAVCGVTDVCPFYDKAEEDPGYYFCVERMMRKAADAIEELSARADAAEGMLAEQPPIWIPVTERLPEEEGKYLTVFTINTIPPRPVMEVCCYAKDLYKVDKYDFHDKKRKPGFYQYDSEWGFFEMSDITHWMPLPEPPKEGEA